MSSEERCCAVAEADAAADPVQGSVGSSVSGRCACGAVRYRAPAVLRAPVACHCAECRRTSGHYVVAIATGRDGLEIEGAQAMRWWASSPDCRRGFCGICGASLFWERLGSGRISIHAGTLDRPTGLALAGHIFTDEKGDYYEINDALPSAGGTSDRLLRAGVTQRPGQLPGAS